MIAPAPATHLGVRSGTLIVALNCKDGIVLCADKKVGGFAHFPSQPSVRKISELGRLKRKPGAGMFATAGISGLTMLNDDGSFRETWDAESEVEQFFRGRDVRYIDRYVVALAHTLAESFARFAEASRLVVQAETLASGRLERFLRVGLWWRDPSRTFHHDRITFRYIPGQIPLLKPTAESIAERSFAYSEPLLIGNDDAWKVLRDIVDPPFLGWDRDEMKPFEEFRGSDDFKRFARNPPFSAQVSTDDASEFACRLIEVSSQMNKFIGANDSVGLATDCALLRRDSGFEWLWRNRNLPHEDVEAECIAMLDRNLAIFRKLAVGRATEGQAFIMLIDWDPRELDDNSNQVAVDFIPQERYREFLVVNHIEHGPEDQARLWAFDSKTELTAIFMVEIYPESWVICRRALSDDET
jgi:hypothetical protein